MEAMAALEIVRAKIEDRMRERNEAAERSRKAKNYSFANICLAQILGLIDARNIVLDAIKDETPTEQR